MQPGFRLTNVLDVIVGGVVAKQVIKSQLDILEKAVAPMFCSVDGRETLLHAIIEPKDEVPILTTLSGTLHANSLVHVLKHRSGTDVNLQFSNSSEVAIPQL